ncbi:hypothetical protein ACP3V3_02815 [Vibrio sp. PNB22_3_1]
MILERNCFDQFEFLAVTLSGRRDDLLYQFLSAITGEVNDHVVDEIKSALLAASLMPRGERDRYMHECFIPKIRQCADRPKGVARHLLGSLSSEHGPSRVDLLFAMDLMERAHNDGFTMALYKSSHFWSDRCKEQYPISHAVMELLRSRVVRH